MMQPFLAPGACTTIPIWAILSLSEVSRTVFDGLWRILLLPDPQLGVRKQGVLIEHYPPTGVNGA